jgi:hypothetical protein
VLAALPVAAQYPGQVTTTDKNAPEMRAVAVLEWTGDEQHPKASRMVPVSVFDGQELQDGGLYLARPEPLALEGEVEYQLKDNGKNTGLFVIENAALDQGSWMGYGNWKALPKPKAPAASPESWKEDDEGSDRPTLHRKAHPDEGSGKDGGGSGAGGSSSGGQGPAPDPDRPTLHRSDSSSSGTGSSGTGSSGSGSRSGDSGSSGSGSSSPGAAPDPDRPVLHKSADETANNGSPNGGSTNGGSAAGSDSGRPKLKKKNDDDEASVSSLPDVSDPDRPRLIPGRPADMGPTVLPSLIGLPPDMQQQVAVSDSKNTPEHIWSYSWANPADETKYKGDLEDQARTALGLKPPPAAKPAAKKTTSKSTTHKTRLTLPPPPPEPLVDEQFHVFELAYGSGATLVLSARTAGTGANEKFVTIVAQPDLYGNLTVLLKNVTDAAHLDDTPRMRLVDAVDAMADNRGELLFELRGQSQRQFALYRVLRGQATKLFVSSGDSITTTATAAIE